MLCWAKTKSLEFKAQEFRVRQNKHNLKIHLLLFISLQYWFPWSTKYTFLKNLCFWKRRDIQPSMVSHTRNLCSAFTHPSAHTQQWTHTSGAVSSYLCCGTRGAVVGSVPCSRAHHRGIEGGESAVHSLPPPTIPAGPRLELPNFRLWVRLSTIRPQLPGLLVIANCHLGTVLD